MTFDEMLNELRKNAIGGITSLVEINNLVQEMSKIDIQSDARDMAAAYIEDDSMTDQTKWLACVKMMGLFLDLAIEHFQGEMSITLLRSILTETVQKRIDPILAQIGREKRAQQETVQ